MANASPVIALSQISALELLRDLFPTVLVPPAVRSEVGSVATLAWIQVRPLTGPIDSRIAAATLDPGEREAIGLALEIAADYVILDDLPARTLAEHLGLRVVGTLGVLVLAKRRRLLPTIRPQFDALRAAGFFLGERLYQHLLAIAGEQ